MKALIHVFCVQGVVTEVEVQALDVAVLDDFDVFGVIGVIEVDGGFVACKAFDWKPLKNFLAVNDLEGFVAVTEHDETCFDGRPRIEDAGGKGDDSLDEIIV